MSFIHKFNEAISTAKFITSSLHADRKQNFFLVLSQSFYQAEQYHGFMFLGDFFLSFGVFNPNCCINFRPIYYLIDKICLQGDFNFPSIYPSLSYRFIQRSQLQIKKFLSSAQHRLKGFKEA